MHPRPLALILGVVLLPLLIGPALVLAVAVPAQLREHPAFWATVGVDLLYAIQEEARQRGAAQLAVVCGHLDQAKRASLDSCRLTIASEWWVAPLIER